MYDAREPLYLHNVTLMGDVDKITIWSDGAETLKTDIVGLKTIGEAMQRGEAPVWFVGGDRTQWPVEAVGNVLLFVASKMVEDKNVEPTLSTLYGGDIFGPVTPDPRYAGLIIEEDKQTLRWAA